jgi:hypothetical protein
VNSMKGHFLPLLVPVVLLCFLLCHTARAGEGEISCYNKGIDLAEQKARAIGD